MGIRNFILIFFFSLSTVVSIYAQPYASRLGRFTVDQKKGCVPFTVTLTDLNGGCTSGSGLCLMDYEGKGTAQNQFTYTYTTPGTYKLSVLYPSIVPGRDDIDIVVVANTQPSFEMYSCAGKQVSVKVTDNKYEQYIINFGDGYEVALPYTNNIVAESDYHAPISNSYPISVRGINVNSADNCTATTQLFNTIASLSPPAMQTLTAIDAGTIKLEFAKQNDILQRMEIATNNASTFQVYQSMYEKDTLRVSNIKVDDNYYCFRLGAYDPCNNRTDNYSNIICSQNFDLTIDNAVNKLAWSTANTGITSMTIQRNKQNYTTVPGASLSFDDKDIVCKTDYCYKIISNYSGGAKSTSLEKCGTSFTITALPSIENVSAVVTDPGVDLDWLVDPKINKPEYSLFRSIGGSDYQPFAKATDKKFTDGEYTTSGVYCYRVDYTDACSNFSSAGAPSCPIRLDGSLSDHNVVTLNWSKFNSWKDGVRYYVVDRYSSGGKLINSVNMGMDTTYVEDPDPKIQTIRYRIRAVSNKAGLTASLSNNVEIEKKTNVYSPTAFTPNHDKQRLNETFTVSGQYITKVNLKIFDRWGALVFVSGNNEDWNGTREGTPMPEGSYVWKAEITDSSGKIFFKEGTVLLIRSSN